MPAMHFPKIIAFIEGTMERLFINNNFHYVHVVTISNGDSWSIENICKQIGSKYAVANKQTDLVVVWLDRENEHRNLHDLRTEIKAALVSNGADADKIAICVPDRMTENVILADEEVIRQQFGMDDYRYIAEGQNGKALLAQLFSTQGTTYRETVHGVSMMKKIRLERSARNSASVRSFLSGLNLPCWWIQDQ